MSTDFYRAFEDKFRGSRELIKERLAVYLPFISPLKELPLRVHGVDLGCGRGEWLELLDKEGINAIGIDLDEGMLSACHQLQLNVQQADAIGFLKSLPDSSVAVVTSFHMVEHIPFEALQKLIQEALRVLVPGGLLIMETPNPENIQVGTHTFYYDPTHQRPIPPLLLAFLPEHYGFYRTKILRLQHNPSLDGADQINLIDVLTGASPDYAVIAQKQAKSHLLEKFNHAFNTEHGLQLSTLTTRYDAKIENTIHQAQQAIASAANASAAVQQVIESASNTAAIAQQATTSASSASAIAQQAITVASQTQSLITHFEAELAHQQRLSAATEQRITALLRSTSWRTTAPLRWASSIFRAMLRTALLPVMGFVLRRPWLRIRLSKLLKFTPGVAHSLHLLAINRGIVSPLNAPSAPVTPKHEMPAGPVTPSAPNQTTPSLAPSTNVTTLRIDGDLGAGRTAFRTPLEKILTDTSLAP